MFKKICIGVFPSDESPDICDHYDDEERTGSILHNKDWSPFVCDDIIPNQDE